MGFGDPGRSRNPTAVRCRVAVAPATDGDPMQVVLVNYSSDTPFDVPATNWIAQGDSPPSAGDICLGVFDDDGDLWVMVKVL